MSKFFYSLDLWVITTVVVLLIIGSIFLGDWNGRRERKQAPDGSDLRILTDGALGLMGLLVAFSFAIALIGYDVRRAMAVEEAAAVLSVAYNALLLPQPERTAVIGLVRDYADLGVRMEAPNERSAIGYNEAQALSLLSRMWGQAVAASSSGAPTPTVQGFVASLDRLSAAHVKRTAAMNNHVPLAVIVLLVGASMVAMGFTGFHSGLAGDRRTGAALIMGLTLAFAIMLIIDLDRPGRG